MKLSRAKSVRSKAYSPPRDIKPLEGKVFVITGGNNGIGKATILALAEHGPAVIYLCARNLSKGRAAVDEIKKTVSDASIRLVELDLACLASVAKAAHQICSETDRIDILINNAGVMAVPPTKTVDGYEMQWATNYMGHALFTRQLLPTLARTASQPNSDVRIINVSSYGHTTAPSPGINFADTSLPKSNIWGRYGQSKLGLVLHSKALAKRYPQIACVSLHPGAIETNLADTFVGEKASKVLHPLIGPFLKTAEEGAFNQLWLATSPREGIQSGAYYVPVGKLDKGSKYAQDEAMADKLWTWTESEFLRKGFALLGAGAGQDVRAEMAPPIGQTAMIAA